MINTDKVPIQEIELENKLEELLPECTYIQRGNFVFVKVIRIDSIVFENIDMKDQPKEHYKFSGILRLKMYDNEDDKKNDKGRMPGIIEKMYSFMGILFENEESNPIKIIGPIIIWSH